MGTRLDVWQVVETIGEANNSIEDAAAYLELPIGKLQACLHYYADYPQEIEQWSALARGHDVVSVPLREPRRRQATDLVAGAG